MLNISGLYPLRLLFSSHLLRILNNINHETSTKQNSRLIKRMMLITIPVSVIFNNQTNSPKDLPQRPNTTSLQQQTRPVLNRLTHPQHRKGTQNMPMRHDQHILRHILRRPNNISVPSRAYILDKPIQPIRDIRRRPVQLSLAHYPGVPSRSACSVHLLSTRTPIPPNIPLRQPSLIALLLDLRALNTLVISIIPLPNILRDLHRRIAAHPHIWVWFLGPGKLLRPSNV